MSPVLALEAEDPKEILRQLPQGISKPTRLYHVPQNTWFRYHDLVLVKADLPPFEDYQACRVVRAASESNYQVGHTLRLFIDAYVYPVNYKFYIHAGVQQEAEDPKEILRQHALSRRPSTINQAMMLIDVPEDKWFDWRGVVFSKLNDTRKGGYSVCRVECAPPKEVCRYEVGETVVLDNMKVYPTYAYMEPRQEAEDPKALLRSAKPRSIHRPMDYSDVPVGPLFRYGYLVYEKTGKVNQWGDAESVVKRVDLSPMHQKALMGEIVTFDEHAIVYPVDYSPEEAKRVMRWEEAEDPKELLRQLTSTPAFLSSLGFRHVDPRFWTRHSRMSAAELYGVCSIEVLGHPQIYMFRIVYQLLRPDKTTWRSYRINKQYVPMSPEDQRNVRAMIQTLVRSFDQAIKNGHSRAPGANDTDIYRLSVDHETTAAIRSFESEWDAMMDQPL